MSIESQLRKQLFRLSVSIECWRLFGADWSIAEVTIGVGMSGPEAVVQSRGLLIKIADDRGTAYVTARLAGTEGESNTVAALLAALTHSPRLWNDLLQSSWRHQLRELALHMIEVREMLAPARYLETKRSIERLVNTSLGSRPPEGSS